MRPITVLFLLHCIMLMAGSHIIYGQSQIESADCDQGWAIPPRVDPRDRYIHCLNYWGIMRGELPGCPTPGRAEDYASNVMALGDLNGDNIADWGVQRNRCDTSPQGRMPVEWLLYHGVRDGLPEVTSGQRIGISEVHTATTLLGSGDWDRDGHKDVVVGVRIFNDTSYGNVEGYSLTSLIVFWGQISGEFSISDTTRLACGGVDKCLGVLQALSSDFDEDGIDDLFVWGGGVLSNGQPLQTGQLHFFRGNAERWRADNSQRSADVSWWNIPPMNRLGMSDHDCDGHRDIVLLNDVRAGTGHVSVLYGQPGKLPDTANVQTVNLLNANGHFVLMTDVTGDNVPELVVNCGSEELLKMYVGKAGQRLQEQFGDGLSPWAQVWLPLKIHDGWFSAGFTPLYDLGDGDEDGISDIWVYSPPFMLGYTGRGKWLDSLIDIAFRWGAVINAVSLGDIDGSGKSSFAVSFGGTPGGMAFYKGTDSAYHFGTILRKLPHGEGERCARSAGIEIMEERKERLAIQLFAIPNPASHDIQLRWEGVSTLAGATITLHDLAGMEVRRVSLPASATEIYITTSGLPSGAYLVTLHTGAVATSVHVMVR